MKKIDEDIAKTEKVLARYKGVKGKENMASKLEAKLNKMKGKKSSPKPKPKAKGDCPEFITDALKSIQDMVDLVDGGGSVDEGKVVKIFEKLKVNKPQLGDDVLELIKSNRKLVLTPIEGVEVEIGDKLPEIFWVSYSDLQSSNNVYLYGGAGTGKTFTSKKLAEALNCTLITINCNQFTSPLEIIGGQTIEGYQEGKLTTAWGNLTSDEEGVTGGMEEGTTGCLLLLDELPKIDPNTAGLLNDALSEVKNRGTIENARGRKIEMKRFFCIATGNSKLSEESVDYVANFRQDLSLQDRFAGSTYEIFVDQSTLERLMKGYLFIYIFMNTVQQLIVSTEGKSRNLESKAFVSIRIMQSLRDSWMFWYENHEQEPLVKTIEQGIDSFFGLFSQSQKEWIIKESKYNDFKGVIRIMEGKPLGTDTLAQTKEAGEIVKAWEKSKKARVS